MYSFQSRIRYSEVDQSKCLSLSSLINYFQDCSTFQSEDIGKGLDYLKHKNHAWVLNSWQIVIERLPSLCEEVTTGTWAHGFKGMYGYRNFIMKDSNQSTLAAANSIWVLLDTLTAHPIRITEEALSGYEQESPYPIPYAPRKIEIPETLNDFTPIPVISSFIDTNNHVNNGQYVRMAQEYLPPAFPLYQMRAEYRNSAVLGDMILPQAGIRNDCHTILLSDLNGYPYAIIEFQKGKHL